MFLMKFSSLKASEPVVRTYADLVDYNSPEEVDGKERSTLTLQLWTEVMSVPDIDLPEWYSIDIGDIKTAKKPLHLLDETDFAKMKPQEIREVKHRVFDMAIESTHKDLSFSRKVTDLYNETDLKKLPRKIIDIIELLETMGLKYRETSSEQAREIQLKLLRDQAYSEKEHYKLHLQKQQNIFLKEMNNLITATADPAHTKRAIVYAACEIYFIAEFEGIVAAKRHLQDLILQAHGDIYANNHLTAFEYSIMCCVARLDFLFDKSITDLSDKQKKYRLKLSKDDVSGEDHDLYDEIYASSTDYETIIQNIMQVTSKIIKQENEMKRLSLETELRDKILEFRSLNSQEHINSTLYTVAEIAMQTYCVLLAQDAKIRERFINSDPLIGKHQPNQELIRQWIICPEFVDPQSELRNQLWRKFEDETKYRFDVVGYCKQLLIDAAKERISYSGLPQASASQIAAGMSQTQSSQKNKLKL